MEDKLMSSLVAIRKARAAGFNNDVVVILPAAAAAAAAAQAGCTDTKGRFVVHRITPEEAS